MSWAVEIAQRIVRQRGQVNHRVKPFEVGDIYVPKVLPDGRNPGTRRPKVTVFKKSAVQPHDFVASSHQHGCSDCTDVTEMTGQKDTHELFGCYVIPSCIHPANF